ncbi:bifunctional 3-(3-hydroxy-phenyl)propionate/3-hydroxycinnamic acid hydroxylase [Herbaspirillum sp. GCM10030257]|uniref:bifunctional 3-(3-hydroxy-phenyl)propionate/3-hydroxycinnamic acid hydroxylase n=1 Tax=Herbaspirillum sp. GCM10030257 TaxID=3273393 RepID=UPI003611014E
MTHQLHSADVLIVGAGPTGLTLANLLGQEGVNVILIDRKPSTVGEPRAVSIDDESLRTMQAAGLADEVLKDVVPGYGVHYYTRPGGRCFAKVEPTASEYGFPRRNAFRQPLFEASLRQGLKRFSNVHVRFGHNLVSFGNSHAGVKAQIEVEGGNPITVQARYMVGCDGGRSPVREMLGIVLAGSTFKSRWLVLDTEDDDDPFWQTRVYCDARRPVVDVPGPHHTRRFEFMIHPDENGDDAMQPETMAELLRPFRGDRPTNIIRKVVYTFHARMAERWRVQSVFLAGDAAHLTPPYAGQGMNSGVRDAHNLGWKLAAAIRGRITDAALDSYEMERRGHAWALIRLALNLGEVMAPRSRFHAWLAHTFFSLTRYVRPVNDYFLQMRFKPKPRYDAGLLGPVDTLGKFSLRGRMFPQPRVACSGLEDTPLDDVIGNRFAIICYAPDSIDALMAPTHPLWDALDMARIVIHQKDSPHFNLKDHPSWIQVSDKNGLLKNYLAAHHGKMILVRPDRYVAGVFDRADESHFADDLARSMGITLAAKPMSAGSRAAA